MSGNKEQKGAVLACLPIILLPAANLLMLVFAPVSFQPCTLLFSLLGAVTEELLFRAFVLKTILLPRMKPVPAILLTAFLFAALHLLNLGNGTPFAAVLPQIFCALCFGIWAGAVVRRKNSICIPLIAHLLLNLTALTDGTLLPLIAGAAVLADGILLL